MVDDGIRFMTERGRRWGSGQPVHRPQLVAPGALPPRGRPARAVAGDLRRRGPPRRVARRADRDARRQRVAVAAAPRRRRHRRPVRAAGRCLGAEGRRPAVVRVQRPARHDGVRRRRPTSARRTPVSASWTGGWTTASGTNAWMTAEIGLPVVPGRGRLRRGPLRRRHRRPDADPPCASSTSAARTPSATRCSGRCWSRPCGPGGSTWPGR